MANELWVELKYAKDVQSKARGIPQGTDTVICHFKTPRTGQYRPHGMGGSIAFTKAGGQATDYLGVLSTTPGDLTKNGNNSADGQTGKVYFAPKGVNLEPDTDYYLTLDNVTGVEDLTTDVTLYGR